MKTILVGGTHANNAARPWRAPESKFAQEARNNEVDVSIGGTIGGGFIWSTQLEIWRFKKDMGTDTWVAAAHSLLSYIDAYCDGCANIIAHSHGGNVAAIAASFAWGKINHLVTVGTPVRKSLDETYSLAFLGLRGNWSHIYSTSDWWQMFGTFGTFNPWKKRTISYANSNILAEGKNHTELHDPALWTEKNWWELVK